MGKKKYITSTQPIDGGSTMPELQSRLMAELKHLDIEGLSITCDTTGIWVCGAPATEEIGKFAEREIARMTHGAYRVFGFVRVLPYNGTVNSNDPLAGRGPDDSGKRDDTESGHISGENIARYVANDLPSDSADTVKAHLENCRACAIKVIALENAIQNMQDDSAE